MQGLSAHRSPSCLLTCDLLLTGPLMAKQQHGEGGITAIADIVAKAFTELKEDMDRIVNSGEVQSPAGTLPAGAAGASEEQLPAVQLGHGRTCSESPGYDDVELPDLEYSMPEALQSMDVPSPGSLAAAPAASSAAEGCGISVHRTYATNAAGSRDPSFTLQQQQSSTRGSPTALAANGPCNIFATDSPPLADMTACVDMAATPSAAALPAAAPAAASPVQAATKQLAMFSAGNSINPSSSGTASLAAGGNWLQDTAVAADDAAGSRPPASSHLTYTELLDRAVAGMDPRLQQMSSNLLTRTSSRASVERRRTSGEGASRRSSGSSAGGTSAAQPSSCGRAAAAARPAGAGMLSLDGGFGRQQPPGLLSVRPWQAKSKFPAGSAVAAAGGAARRSSARSAAENSTEASMRIFKQGSGSAMKLLVEVDELGAFGAGAAEQRRATVRSSFDSQAGRTGQRSRSAPREVADVTHHVKRLHHSPARPARAEGCGTATLSSPPEQQQGGSGRPKSDPRHTKGYIDRLYMQGVEKQIKRAHQPEHRNVSPVRLLEEDWNRVTRRLHLDARAKDERMRERREHQSDKIDAAARPTHAQALQDSTAQRSSGGGGRTAGSSGGGNRPSAAFYERQQALTERRKQRQEQRRPSDEGELEECLFHPQINPVYVLSEEKAEHEYDGYTWAPQINSSSRRIALASYAAAPDPARPWTTRHKTAPPRQASPPRQPSPPPRSIASAGASYGYFPAEVHYAHPSPQEQQKQEQQLRHGIAGAPMAGAAGGQEVPASTSCLVLAEPGISQPLRAAAGQAAGSDGAQARPAAAAAWQQRAAQLVEQLPPGTVVGIPVAEAAAVQFRSGQPAAAMATPHQAVTGSSRASKAMVPVAAGDGVAFISLGPIRTAAAAAQPGASVDAGSAGGSADWGHHLGRAGGSGSYDDSAANTPTKHQFGAAGRHERRPPLSKLKQQEGGVLHPTLSDATRAALELSHLAIGVANPADSIGLADAPADHCYPHLHHQQQHRQAAEIDAFKQMLGGVGVENSAMLVSEHTVIDNGQLQEQLAEMTAGMLNQTHHNLLTVGQRAVLLASKLSASSKVADARQAGEAAWPAGPEGVSLAAPAEASVVVQPVAAEPHEVRSSWTGAAQQAEAASTGGLAEAASHPAPPGSCSVGGQSGVQAVGAKVAAEPATEPGGQGTEDGPFKKTISRHNLPINDLEKTLAALLPAAAATATAPQQLLAARGVSAMAASWDASSLLACGFAAGLLELQSSNAGAQVPDPALAHVALAAILVTAGPRSSYANDVILNFQVLDCDDHQVHHMPSCTLRTSTTLLPQLAALLYRYLLKTDDSGAVSFNKNPNLIHYCWGRGNKLCHWTASDGAGTQYTSGSPDTLRNAYDVPVTPAQLANCTCRGGDACPREVVYPEVITFRPASCTPPPIYVNAPVLNPACVAKYQSTLLLPPIMPRLTGVWAYGADINGKTTHNWPGYTIEATRNKPVQIRWINELFDLNRRYRPHLLADQLDQTLHWANPNELGTMGTDHSPCMDCPDGAMCDLAACTTAATTKYTGPAPTVSHVHGMEGVQDNSDGYAEAWFLPNATNLAGYTPFGKWYETFRDEAQANNPGSLYGPGLATYTYPTAQRPAQLWYHDHVLGATRLNVYTGLAGFFMIRSYFPDRKPELPGIPFPPPGKGPNANARELPLVIQDRAFDVNNQLYYPKQSPTNLPPEEALPVGPVPHTWVPEFFAQLPDGSNATLMTVNGRVSPRHRLTQTWHSNVFADLLQPAPQDGVLPEQELQIRRVHCESPHATPTAAHEFKMPSAAVRFPLQDVVREPYRLRLLNGCNAKTLIIYFSTVQPTVGAEVVTEDLIPFYVIGNEGGFFPSAVEATQVVMGDAERYDIIIDFSGVAAGSSVYMLNKGPGRVTPATTQDASMACKHAGKHWWSVCTCSQYATPPATCTGCLHVSSTGMLVQKFSLLEEFAPSGNPIAQYIGTVSGDNVNPAALTAVKQFWMDPVTALTDLNTTEEWTIINLTPDAHPIHIHEVLFEVVKYERIAVVDESTKPSSSPDTTLMPPNYATTVRFTTSNRPGLFVWHCHLLEHEDNEMMHPWCVGNPGYINPHTGEPMCEPEPMP
ncbi:hypothetical protein COO60DRAFT_1460964 [Scenedesmus sp. NREL 46B-D3]|nr:hypothetical protein COO60DRAFT_1460964 [Scenedesmus sp. NREL 46B-D3]